MKKILFTLTFAAFFILTFLKPGLCDNASETLESSVDGTDYQAILDKEIQNMKNQQLYTTTGNSIPLSDSLNHLQVLNISQSNIVGSLQTTQQDIVNTQKPSSVSIVADPPPTSPPKQVQSMKNSPQ